MKKADIGLIGLAVYLFCMLLRWQVMSSPAGAPVVLAIVNGILLLATFGFPMILSLILLVQTTKTNQLLCALEKMRKGTRWNGFYTERCISDALGTEYQGLILGSL